MMQDLKKRLEVMQEILLTAFHSLDVVEYLLEKEDSIANHIKTKNHFFSFTQSIYWRITIIELYKLVSTSDQHDEFNFNSLFKELNTESNLTNDIKVWKEDFKTDPTLKKIRILRSSVYAHTSLKGIKKDYKLSTTDVLITIRNLQDIILKVSNHYSLGLLPFAEITYVKLEVKKIIREMVNKRQEFAELEKIITTKDTH